MVVKRYFVTLIEIMIVIFLIGLVVGSLAYNYTGTLEAGKVFKTERAMEKIQNILSLKVAEDPKLLDNLHTDWLKYLEQSPLVSNPNELARDGWGKEFQVEVRDGVIKVTSPGYEEYLKKRK